MATTESKEIMNPKEAAVYLGLHPVTIYRLLKSKSLPGIKIGGQWRFKKTELDTIFVIRQKMLRDE